MPCDHGGVPATAAARVTVVDPGPPLAAPLGCVDVGSTFTKLAAVEPGTGRLLAIASHPTTAGTDAAEGVRACRHAVAARLGADPAELVGCSSVGGGLRLAVVGQERLVSAEAGRRVALSAGARVVRLCAGMLDSAGVADLLDAEPDVVLLVGGTDGGDDTVLRHNAGMLADRGLTAPVVVAGNVAVRDEVCARLERAGTVVHPTANVLPDIGEIDPGPARAVIREVFLRHVIGGKRLSAAPEFARMVRAVTPDAVLDGVRVLAEVCRVADGAENAGAGILVVDVGGATTDVYSVVCGEGGPARHVVGDMPDRRTVEGDLGVRFSAPWVVDAAVAQQLVAPERAEALRPAAAHRAAERGYLPDSPAEAAIDVTLAGLAATVAVRRHLHAGGVGTLGISRVVCSGGVFRHAGPTELAGLLAGLRSDPTLRGPLGAASIVVDRHYVLAAVGLLAGIDPPAARTLASRCMFSRENMLK